MSVPWVYSFRLYASSTPTFQEQHAVISSKPKRFRIALNVPKSLANVFRVQSTAKKPTYQHPEEEDEEEEDEDAVFLYDDDDIDENSLADNESVETNETISMAIEVMDSDYLAQSVSLVNDKPASPPMFHSINLPPSAPPVTEIMKPQLLHSINLPPSASLAIEIKKPQFVNSINLTQLAPPETGIMKPSLVSLTNDKPESRMSPGVLAHPSINENRKRKASVASVAEKMKTIKRKRVQTMDFPSIALNLLIDENEDIGSDLEDSVS